MIDLDRSNPGERNRLAGILDTIASEEGEADRPWLPVVVVNSAPTMPGGAFLTMSRSQGQMRPGQDKL